jgi:hypothetical protein
MVKLVASGLLLLAVALVGGPAQGASQAVHKSLRPHRGKSVLVTPTKGVVILYRRGNRKAVSGTPESLRVGRSVRVPLGSVLDTSSGGATVTSAISRFGSVTARGSFSQGVFAVDQTGSDTAISLGGNGARVCSEPRRLVSRAPGSFMVLAGRSASRPINAAGEPSSTPVPWVAKDRCTATTIKGRTRRIEVVDIGSRSATARRAHRIFSHTRGFFTTRGQNSSATVQGKVVAR